jgi:hypothetical protein
MKHHFKRLQNIDLTREKIRRWTIYGSTSLVDLGLFQFLNLYTVGRTPWTGHQPVTRSLPTHRTTQTQNKRIQTSMPLLGFEPTIPGFERATTVHALDRAAKVIGCVGRLRNEKRGGWKAGRTNLVETWMDMYVYTYGQTDIKRHICR